MWAVDRKSIDIFWLCEIAVNNVGVRNDMPVHVCNYEWNMNKHISRRNRIVCFVRCVCIGQTAHSDHLLHLYADWLTGWWVQMSSHTTTISIRIFASEPSPSRYVRIIFAYHLTGVKLIERSQCVVHGQLIKHVLYPVYKFNRVQSSFGQVMHLQTMLIVSIQWFHTYAVCIHFDACQILQNLSENGCLIYIF